MMSGSRAVAVAAGLLMTLATGCATDRPAPSCSPHVVVYTRPESGNTELVASWHRRLLVELDDNHVYWIARNDGGIDVYPTGTKVTLCQVKRGRDKQVFYSIRDDDAPGSRLVDAPMVQ